MEVAGIIDVTDLWRTKGTYIIRTKDGTLLSINTHKIKGGSTLNHKGISGDIIVKEWKDGFSGEERNDINKSNITTFFDNPTSVQYFRKSK